jgi:endoglycosylceramidase
LFEKYRFGHTYWAYYPGVENDLYFQKTFKRPYSQLISGTLKTSGFDDETGLFTCQWDESASVKAPTIIYIPDLKNLIKESIKLSPDVSNTIVQSIANCDGGYLIIPASGKATGRTVEFRLSLTRNAISIK